MKWEHKTLGWTAQTAYYDMPESNITCTILKDGGEINFSLQRLLIENPLKSNQALSNLTVNFKNSFILGIVSTVTCTVTADIVEFK